MLVVICILQGHVVEIQPLTGKAALSYVEEGAIPSVGVNGPWWNQLLTVMQRRPCTEECYRLHIRVMLQGSEY